MYDILRDRGMPYGTKDRLWTNIMTNNDVLGSLGSWSFQMGWKPFFAFFAQLMNDPHIILYILPPRYPRQNDVFCVFQSSINRTSSWVANLGKKLNYLTWQALLIYFSKTSSSKFLWKGNEQEISEVRWVVCRQAANGIASHQRICVTKGFDVLLLSLIVMNTNFSTHDYAMTDPSLKAMCVLSDGARFLKNLRSLKYDEIANRCNLARSLLLVLTCLTTQVSATPHNLDVTRNVFSAGQQAACPAHARRELQAACITSGRRE